MSPLACRKQVVGKAGFTDGMMFVGKRAGRHYVVGKEVDGPDWRVRGCEAGSTDTALVALADPAIEAGRHEGELPQEETLECTEWRLWFSFVSFSWESVQSEVVILQKPSDSASALMYMHAYFESCHTKREIAGLLGGEGG